METTKEKDKYLGLPVGNIYKSRERTISEGEFHVMQSLMWQTAGIHTDREHMKTTPFGDRIMSGSIMMCVAMGLEGTTDERAAYRNAGFKDGAQLGIEYVKFIAPVHPGDSVWAEVKWLDARPSEKNPNRWIAKRQLRLYKRPNILCLDSARYSMINKA